MTDTSLTNDRIKHVATAGSTMLQSSSIDFKSSEKLEEISWTAKVHMDPDGGGGSSPTELQAIHSHRLQGWLAELCNAPERGMPLMLMWSEVDLNWALHAFIFYSHFNNCNVMSVTISTRLVSDIGIGSYTMLLHIQSCLQMWSDIGHN